MSGYKYEEIAYKDFDIVVNNHKIGLILTKSGTVIQKVANVTSAVKYIMSAKKFIDSLSGEEESIPLPVYIDEADVDLSNTKLTQEFMKLITKPFKVKSGNIIRLSTPSSWELSGYHKNTRTLKQFKRKHGGINVPL